ncbi:MAG: hypothetical protein R3D71_03250 [Rickettsiales bacterium]
MIKNSIPLIDLRGKTPIDLLRAYPDSAKTLVESARKSYGVLSNMASSIVLPFVDKRSHNWLVKSNNPFLHEIETFDSIIGKRGVFSLNLAYEWGCTSGAYRNGESVAMVRILDWPFPDLGKYVVITLQDGKAGEFYNITWPGISGVFNATAHNRFSAALNLAPMRRYGINIVADWIKNRRIAYGNSGLPPAHLLRQVFENAENYEEAKKILAETPVAVPAIFILTGTEFSDGCIIERLENDYRIREIGADQQVVASNQFQTDLATGTKARPFFDSNGRWQHGCSLQGYEIIKPDFSWLTPPILNPLTRLCVIADSVSKQLYVQGFEGITPITEIFELPNNNKEDIVNENDVDDYVDEEYMKIGIDLESSYDEDEEENSSY